MGLSLIPAFGTLYQRLTLGESTRYEKSKALDVNGGGERSGNGEEDEIHQVRFLHVFPPPRYSKSPYLPESVPKTRYSHLATLVERTPAQTRSEGGEGEWSECGCGE